MKWYGLLAAISLLIIYKTAYANVELKDFKCTVFDQAFGVFEYCYIKAINRSYKYASAKAKIFQRPINNVSVNLAIKKRANGFKPFLYDIRIDACKFMRERKNPLINFFYAFLEKHSNMNHTCPYNHDIFIEKLDVAYLDNLLTKILPMPEGIYGFYSTWYTYNVKRMEVTTFVTVKD